MIEPVAVYLNHEGFWHSREGLNMLMTTVAGGDAWRVVTIAAGRQTEVNFVGKGGASG